ncbi:MAG: hypothetical protein [Microviridae sp.]|nr:MAG: hypothetical protein [Microviridae sp.]
MYNVKHKSKTTLKGKPAYEGETIEEKVNRILNNGEPITDGAPLIYTERKDGVNPMYDIRTDRFEIAVDAMDKVSKSHTAKRDAKPIVPEKETKKDGGAEPIQATN